MGGQGGRWKQHAQLLIFYFYLIPDDESKSLKYNCLEPFHFVYRPMEFFVYYKF